MYLLFLLFLASQYLLSVYGTNLLFGRGKILYFGHVGFSIFATYALFLTVHYTGSYVYGISVSIIAASLLAILMAFLALRLDEDSFGILSIAIHLIILAGIVNWASFTRGAMGIPRIPLAGIFPSQLSLLLSGITCALLWTFFLYQLDHSSLGRGLAAFSENKAHAEALGINRCRLYIWAFLIEGIGTVLGNFFYFQYAGIVHPNDFSFSSLVFILMIVVAGKPGSVLGCALATFLLTFLKEGIRFLPIPLGMLGPVRLVFFGLILIVAVYVRRNELFPKERSV